MNWDPWKAIEQEAPKKKFRLAPESGFENREFRCHTWCFLIIHIKFFMSSVPDSIVLKFLVICCGSVTDLSAKLLLE
jgi:hypothetical protein